MGETLLERRERIDMARLRLNLAHNRARWDACPSGDEDGWVFTTWADLVHDFWWTAHLAAYLVKEQVR